jgi:hypothetical protein
MDYKEIEFDGDALRCPHCGNQYLHQTRVEVFTRAYEDGPSFGVNIENGNSNNRIESSNPSDRRQGLLVHFFCEHCCGCPPEQIPNTQAKPGWQYRSKNEYEIPMALAVYQHKGATLLAWRGDVKPNWRTKAPRKAGITECDPFLDGKENFE